MGSPRLAPHTEARSIEEATAASGEFRAGGTDLQERLQIGIARDGIVDISDIPDLGRIDFTDAGCTIGALVSVESVGASIELQRRYPALVLPAQTLATPQIRHQATMGGVLCQRTRCWYYRHPDLACPKKGDDCACPARVGNNRYGVAFDLGPCAYPHPSSMGLALLTYDAAVSVSGPVGDRRIRIAELYGNGGDVTRDHTLGRGELLTHIHLPPPREGERAFYLRQMSREWAEWPLVEVVVRIVVERDVVSDVRVGVGAVANIPLRLRDVEAELIGKAATNENLRYAASRAGAHANPSAQTAYKVPMVVACVLTALEGALGIAGGER